VVVRNCIIQLSLSCSYSYRTIPCCIIRYRTVSYCKLDRRVAGSRTWNLGTCDALTAPLCACCACNVAPASYYALPVTRNLVYTNHYTTTIQHNSLAIPATTTVPTYQHAQSGNVNPACIRTLAQPPSYLLSTYQSPQISKSQEI
jgi:hypothetical protein